MSLVTMATTIRGHVQQRTVFQSTRRWQRNRRGPATSTQREQLSHISGRVYYLPIVAVVSTCRTRI